MPDSSGRCRPQPGDEALAPSFYDDKPVTGGTVRPSKMGRRRAWVLLAIHVIVFARILWWKLNDEKAMLSPVEPSEAMFTIASGAVNAGAILLLLSLVATLIFGRFFCGWACHLVALQDGSAWLLKKMGIRPRPLRSRALVWVPLGAGIFLFGMPLFVRLWMGLGLPTMSNGLVKAEFWETFPGPWVAILTFLVCGFLMVYLLGSKGFCTYACPYGGLFGVVDRIAPGRIRVDDKCKACGHCSATCTSNVQVAEEVHRFGMVVDPGCMKCMDCVSVCPENALHFGFGGLPVGAEYREARKKAAASRKRKKAFDFSLKEEIALVLLFALSLFILRGLPEDFWPWAGRLYGELPLLFALGLAAVSAFTALFAWRLLRRRDLTFQSWTLKKDGAMRVAGWAFGAFALLYLGFMAHSAYLQYFMFRGDHAFQRLDIPKLAARGPGESLSAEERSLIETAEANFARAESTRLLPDIRPSSRLGGLMVARRDLTEAERYFQRAIDIRDDYVPSFEDLFRIQMSLAGKLEAESRRLAETGDQAGAEKKNAEARAAAARARKTLEKAHSLQPEDLAMTRRLAAVYLQSQDTQAALPLLRQVTEADLEDAAARAELGSILLASPQTAPEGAAFIEEALELDPSLGGAAANLGNWYLFGKQDAAAAVPWLRKAVATQPLNIDLRMVLEEALVRTGQTEALAADRADTRRALEEAVLKDPKNPNLLFVTAQQYERAKLYDRAIELLDRVIEAQPNAAAAYDLKGRLLIASGKKDEGEAWRKKAQEVQAENARTMTPPK